MPKIIIYTDGSCDNNHPKRPMGWAAILRFIADDGSEIAYREIVDGDYDGTNNIAEINAVIAGLEALSPTPYDVEIYTDSTYVKGAIEGNKINANHELIKRMKFLMSKYKASVYKVPAHKDDEYNNLADLLAKEMYKKMAEMLPDFETLSMAWLQVAPDQFNWIKSNMNWSRNLSQGTDTLIFLMDELADNGIPVYDDRLAADIMSAHECELMLISVRVEDDSTDGRT